MKKALSVIKDCPQSSKNPKSQRSRNFINACYPYFYPGFDIFKTRFYFMEDTGITFSIFHKI